MENGTLTSIVAIICLTVLEVVNLLTFGIDSGVLGVITSAIAGIAGYNVGIYRERRKR